MTVDDAVAGYFELRRERRTRSVEIVYFGLLPEFTGRGLGGFLLTDAVERAWASAPAGCGCTPAASITPSPSRTISTRGFTVFKTEQYVVQAPSPGLSTV